MTRKRKIKKHGFSNRKIAYGVIAVVIIAAGVFLGFQLCTGNLIELNPTSQYRAVIVDQLSASMPNQTFVTEATTMMTEAGFNVDYYPSSKVTVGFYRDLPTYGYDLIVLRVHSAIGNGTGTSKFVLFSSEAYSEVKYQYEQLTNKVGHVKVTEESESYFGIYPDFVKYSMKGDFNDAVVVMMGCGGTIYPYMYEAFIDKGVMTYFGWDERVDISHTDTATMCLLNHLLIQNETMGEAIENTMNEVGPDPTYDSDFLCCGTIDAKDAYVVR